MAADDDTVREDTKENAGASSAINNEKPPSDIKIEKNSSTEASSIAEFEKAEITEQVQQPLAQDTKVNIEEDLAHLPEHQQEILKRQLLIPEIKTSYLSCFRYATKSDKLIIFVSSVASIGAGAALPLMTVCFKSKQAGQFRN